MNRFDYIIVGDGLAGTTLIWHLLKYDKRIVWVVDSSKPSSSRVAAGIYNPLTGKKLVKTWMADQLFPYANSFYQEVESAVGQQFWHPMHMLRPFRSIEEQNTYMAQAAEPSLHNYIEGISACEDYQAVMKAPNGGLEVKNAGWLDINTFLDATTAHLSKKVVRIDKAFEEADLIINDDSVSWNEYVANKIVLCTGESERHRTLFQWLPFNPVKGQVLEVEMPNFPTHHIVNQGAFILPLKNGNFKIGATYSWHDLDWEISEEGKNYLQGKVGEFLEAPYTIRSQKAGIRPSSKDRRPLLGIHPEYDRIAVFNGLGTKGVTLAPYFADELTEFLEKGKELNPLVNINRYFSLYYDHKKSD